MGSEMCIRDRSNKLSKPESTPFFSVPAIGCDPINNGCIFSQELIIGSLIEPTSVTIASLGITLINSWEGWIKSFIGNAKIIKEHSFKIPKSQLIIFASLFSIAFFSVSVFFCCLLVFSLCCFLYLLWLSAYCCRRRIGFRASPDDGPALCYPCRGD